MTSRDFMARQFGNADGKTKWLSSIMKDGDGNIYSYGPHYPLIFKVENLVVINRRGYSNTTAKHISWAYGAVAGEGYTVVSVELSSNDRMPITRAIVELRLAEQFDRIKAEMASKKRQDTRIYEMLQYDLARVGDAIATVRGTK